MNFLNPLLLLGVLGLALPILAHLLNRHQVQRTDWAAMRFLNRSVRVRSRQLRLRDLLLLLMRCLALLMLVFALARPFGASHGNALAAMGENRAGVVIAIDASCSMQYSNGKDTRFARALRKADVIARSIRPGDPVSVVLLGSEHRVLMRNTAFDPAAFSELLNGQMATAESLDLDSVPRFLGNLTAELTVPQREIYIISDMSEQAWQSRSVFLKASFRDLAAGASVLMVPIDGGAENLGVTGLELISGVLRKDTTARYRATIRNYGEQEAKNVRVSGLMNDINVDSKVIPSIAPGASESVSLFIPFRDPGAVRIAAALEPDSLMADNTRRAVAVIRDKVSVLCVDGDTAGGASSRLIAAALQAHRSISGKEDLAVQSVSWTELPAQNLDGFDLVVLADVPDITVEQAQAFENYVRKGRGLIWFGGDRIKASVWNERSTRGNGASLLPAVIEEVVATTDSMGVGRPLDPSLTNHPACRSLSALPEDLLSEARFHRVLQVKPAPTSTRILTLAGSDTPVLLGHSLGRGQVFMFTTSAGASWNNMAVTPIFPLLLQQMVTYLTAREFETPHTVGDSLALTYTDQPGATDAVFESPSGELISVPVREYRNRYVALLDNAREAGFYQARVNPQAPGTPIAVNVDTHESAVKGLSSDAATKILAGTNVRVASTDDGLIEAINEGRTVRSFWPLFMMAGILFLVGEGLFAGLLTRRRSI
ncbi:MAG: BatA domain-containing protein [Verrucomicrobia bacterium]|nr:BatA domain-containing protein [Verrucomicrobiota bacterium]